MTVNLKIDPSKCAFGKHSVSFHGHLLSDKRISTDPEKLARIQKLSPPRNQNEMRSSLGYAIYYRKFIKGFMPSRGLVRSKLTNTCRT